MSKQEAMGRIYFNIHASSSRRYKLIIIAEVNQPILRIITVSKLNTADPSGRAV
jgi:hypothetical protein